MSTPVTLCIPTLSPAGAGRTASLIVAAEAGTRPADRYFIVDNGGHFVFDHPKVMVYRPPQNIGVGPAFNEALRRFPDWIVFANDDVTLAPYTIETLVCTAETSDRWLICSPGHAFCVFLHKQEAVRRVGYYDEGFAPAYYEDTDYLRRVYIAGSDIERAATGVAHHEQATSRDMGWNPHAMMQEMGRRYADKWGGMPGSEKYTLPWGQDIEMVVPSRRRGHLQRLIDSVAWQTVRPRRVTIVSNDRDIELDARGMAVRQIMFRSERVAIGEGDVSLRRNIGTWAATSHYVVYSDDDQVWPQSAIEWFARIFAQGQGFVAGHHRFIEMGDNVSHLRNASAGLGRARESGVNCDHSFQSCYGGCLGIAASEVKRVGGWDLAYPLSEDQQMALRIMGDRIRVWEPPWAWHEPGRSVEPYDSTGANVCPPGTHDHFTVGNKVLCRNCPILRYVSRPDLPESYDPALVQTEERWF